MMYMYDITVQASFSTFAAKLKVLTLVHDLYINDCNLISHTAADIQCSWTGSVMQNLWFNNQSG